MIGNVKATVERSPELDQYGDPVESDDEPRDLNGCTLAPRLSTDASGRVREGVVIGLSLYCPADVDVTRDDIVTITEGPHAGRYRIEGEPSAWESGLTAWSAGVVVELSAAIG